MLFLISGIGLCDNCRAHGREPGRKAFAEEVYAKDDESAKRAFLERKRLCKTCLSENVNLHFDREKLRCTSLGP